MLRRKIESIDFIEGYSC